MHVLLEPHGIAVLGGGVIAPVIAKGVAEPDPRCGEIPVPDDFPRRGGGVLETLFARAQCLLEPDTKMNGVEGAIVRAIRNAVIPSNDGR